jgi:hypothetical protein
VVWTGLIWLRIGTSGGPFSTRTIKHVEDPLVKILKYTTHDIVSIME